VTDRSIVEDLVVMVAPVAPHFAEECWERLGNEGSVLDATWPTWDAGLLSLDRIEIVVQINGKTRSRIQVDRSADEETVVAAALADLAVQRHLDGKQVRKRIYVRERLLNLVVG
jgi:leucyl-tRNA synthetase